MVVDDSDIPSDNSLHFTLNPLKALVMGLISSMAVSGETLSAESLMKLITVVFIITGSRIELEPEAVKVLMYTYYMYS